MKKNKTSFSLLMSGFLVLLVLQGPPVSAAGQGVVFGTPPTQTPEETFRLYGPLAEYLTETTGVKVTLVPAHNFLEYTNKMRKAAYDLIFDGPHFVGWRMDRLDHVPIARLPGELVFALAVKDGSPLSDVRQLVGMKICGLASPNLATLSILDRFDNPVRQPILVPVESFKESLECVSAGTAEAGVMPIKFWNKWEQAGKTADLRLLYVSDDHPLPPRTFSISRAVDEETRAKITEALLHSQGKAGPKPVLDRFRSKNFVPVDPEAYKGLGRLLGGVWGFHQ